MIKDNAQERLLAGAWCGARSILGRWRDRRVANKGERLTTRSVSRIVKQHLRGIGLDSDRLTTHSPRHTAITFSLLGGASIQEARALGRHADINTTMIYAHNIHRIADAPERKIDALLN
jgi:integrase/recombinase XerD